jgi:hypothetical protein
MSWFMVDIEANGPCPGVYSMTEFAVIKWDKDAEHPVRFHGKFTKLDGERVDPEAQKFYEALGTDIRASKPTPQERSIIGLPDVVMRDFVEWVALVNDKGRPMFISDNNGFDYQFINYYCHKYTGSNPFGHSSTNLGSLYKGCVKNVFASFKKLRKTQHTHHPIDDCLGNLEAMDIMAADCVADGFGPDSTFSAIKPRPDQA